MNIIKKFSVGAYISALACLFTLVAVIVYGIGVSLPGYFQGSSIKNLVLLCVLCMVLLVGILALTAADLSGVLATVSRVVCGAVQILVPALLALCLINLIAGRAEGLGFIFFSNADVALEVQTPANLTSASLSIASMVVLAIAMLISVIGAFFNLRRKSA